MSYNGLFALPRIRRRHVIRLISAFLFIGCTLTIMDMKYEAWHVSKQTCPYICSTLPLIQKHELLKPVENITTYENVMGKMSLDFLAHTMLPTSPGGSWAPRRDEQSCTELTPAGVAIIIPVLYKWHQVPGLLLQLIPLLRKQQLCYRIFIVEQTSVGPFNKGILLNAGFVEARRRFEFKCVVFHDVDLIPLDDLNPYGCDADTEKNVIHLSVIIIRGDDRDYAFQYDSLVGGVLKISVDHYIKVNGHSNRYWDWGTGDNDMASRLSAKMIPYKQMTSSVGRYSAMSHSLKFHIWVDRNRTTHSNENDEADSDGLNNVEYKLLVVKETELFTHFLVDFHKPKTF